MTFCTVITCMDGRIQIPVNKYLINRFNAPNVDTITEAGPVGIISAGNDKFIIEGILNRLQISIDNHNSEKIAVVAHHDCAGNPISYEEHLDHLKQSVKFIKEVYPNLEVIGLWVNNAWEVEEI